MWEEIVPIAVAIVTAVAIFFLFSRLLGYKSDKMWIVLIAVVIVTALVATFFTLLATWLLKG